MAQWPKSIGPHHYLYCCPWARAKTLRLSIRVEEAIIATASSSTTLAETDRSHTVSVTRLLVAGGVTAAVVFALCWVGTFVPFSSPTHAYLSLFTNADMSSGRALAEGALWSLLFGALVGAAFALIYNATASLGRR